MRKASSLLPAALATLLLVIVVLGGRLLFVRLHAQTIAQLTDDERQFQLVLTENTTEIATLTSDDAIAAVMNVLDDYTYVEYPALFAPAESRVQQNLLTVTFENGHSVSVNAGGFVFVNGKLRALKDCDNAQALYHALYQLFYPSAY